MSEPLTAVVTRDGNQWKATIDIVGDVAAPSLVELTYAAHARAITVSGKPQAIDFQWPYRKATEAVSQAARQVEDAQHEWDRRAKDAARLLAADNVSTRDVAVLLGVPVHQARMLLSGG